MKAWTVALLLLSGCSEPTVADNRAALASTDLETAAITRGIVPDPDRKDIGGLYARDSDRLCLVDTGDTLRAGALVRYDDATYCSGSGTVDRDGAELTFRLGAQGNCRIVAKLVGNRIVFPSSVPSACETLCRGRASFAAMTVSQLSESRSEAVGLRDPAGQHLCGRT